MGFSWWTAGLQAVNFIILVWLLKRFLFTPVTAMVARRKDEIAKSLAAAEAANQKADQVRHEFEQRIADVEAQRHQVIEQERARLAAERTGMLEAARVEADKLRNEMMRRLDEERKAAASEVFEQAVGLATELSTRLLGEITAPALEHSFLDRLVEHLDRLSDADRAALRGGRAGEPLRITTAHPLAPEEKAKWSAALTARLGNSRIIEFDADAGLIAGAELRFPHATLRFNWRDSIADARRQMIGRRGDAS
ncbi:MAG TPA: F0F1 ATP synthase subunit B [Pseudolabrys sp.]|nr:F0F1 ATP synthase subunit B [Pseudolabrys sp.]